jgi:hypothetical protein
MYFKNLPCFYADPRPLAPDTYQLNEPFALLRYDDLVKSRHSGENRSPAKLEHIDITGFRPSPE